MIAFGKWAGLLNEEKGTIFSFNYTCVLQIFNYFGKNNIIS